MKKLFFIRRTSQFSSLLPLYTMSKEELHQELETHHIQAKKNVNKTDPDQLIHEIEIHQLKLEIQNRELIDSQKLLQDSVAKYQDLYNSAPVSFFTLNEKGRFLQINHTGAVFFESGLKEILGESLNRYVAKDYCSAYADFLDRCLNAKPFQKNDCELLLKIGSGVRLKYVQLTATRTLENKKVALIVVLMDKTQEKKNELLEFEASSLRTEISLREKFINSLSHDLRTPLTSSKLCTQMLSSMLGPDLENDRARQIFKLMVGELDRADSMIKELLDANKIESESNLPLNTKQMCLDLVARSCLQNFTEIYQEELKLNYDVRGDVTGKWSSNCINRILENLLTNAIKYGDTHLPISVMVEDLKDKVGLTVHNFGNPIDPKDQKKIFEAFHQTVNSKVTAVGWGIGLEIVQTLVKRHKGEIRLKSTNSAGTFFQVILPRV